MRRNLLFISLIAIIAAGCTNTDQSYTSVLTGQLDSLKNGELLARISKVNLMGTDFIDTIKVDDQGKFTYTLKDSNYRDVTIMDGTTKHFQVVMLPGETVNVSGTVKNPKLSGKGFYADKAKASEFLKAIDSELVEGRAALMEELKGEKDENIINEKMNSFFNRWREKHDAASLEFIKANPNSNYSYYMTVSLIEPFKSQAMEILSAKVKAGPIKSFDQALAAIFKANDERKKALEEARQKVAPGMIAPDFTLNDINGKPFALSSLKGKYVVLDFWGSWCSWCIKGIPEMKEYYKKYKGKFEIVGIACGDSDSKWKNAVKTNELPWLNVINDEKGGNDVSKIYAVSGYPTKIIIDPKGKILKFIIGEKAEFYTCLDELFKK